MAALRRRLTTRPVWHAIASVLVVAGAIFEPLAAPVGYVPFEGIPRIYGLVQSVPNAVVVDLPFPPPEAFFRNGSVMLNSTAHWKPMLNGYSSFVPASYFRHYEALRTFPSDEAVTALQKWGVTHAFVHVDRLDAAATDALARLVTLRRLAVEGSVELYEVTR
jgi:hypothetical protein